MKFFKLIGSIWEEEPGQLSWSRVFASVTVIAAIRALMKVVETTHHLPPASDLVALGTFGGFPYALRKAAEAFGKNAN